MQNEVCLGPSSYLVPISSLSSTHRRTEPYTEYGSGVETYLQFFPPSFSSLLDRIHSISSRKNYQLPFAECHNISETLYKLISLLLNFHNPEGYCNLHCTTEVIERSTSSQWLNGNLILVLFHKVHMLCSLQHCSGTREKKLVSPVGSKVIIA